MDEPESPAKQPMQPTKHIAAVGVLFGLMLPQSGQKPEVRCTVSKVVECSPTGCADKPSANAYLLIPDLGNLAPGAPVLGKSKSATIRRCDEHRCFPLATTAVESGSYLTFSASAGGYFLKIGLQSAPGVVNRGQFVEVNALALSAVSSFGTCQLPSS